MALIGDLEQHRVLEVAHAEAQHAQRHAALGALLDKVDQPALIGDADVEIAVRAEDHAVDAALDEVVGVGGDLVGGLDPACPVGAAAGLEGVNGGDDQFLAVAAGRGHVKADAVGVDDDRDAVVLVQPCDEHLHGFLDEGQLVGLAHRARHVQQEDQVAGRAFFGGDLAALDADSDQLVLALPGAVGQLDAGGEGLLFAFRLGIVVVEVVDHLLGADRALGRQAIGIEEPSDVGIGGRVDVYREGRQRLLRHQHEGIGHEVVVGFGVELGSVDSSAYCSRVVDRPMARSQFLMHAVLRPAAIAVSDGPGIPWVAAGLKTIGRDDHAAIER